MQETFVRLWHSAARYDPARASVRGFTFMIAKRIATDFVRRASARPQLVAGPEAALVDARVEDELDRVVALPRRRPLRTAALALAACVVLALAVALGAVMGGGETTRTADRQPGAFERDATLAAIGGGGAEATARITRVSVGRIIELRSTTLPKLPPSQYYELWFVGKGDAPAAPNRVSAGTFHPDSRGRVVARLFAAANPRKLPVLAVTRERRDGDPAATAPDVLRSRV